MLRTLSRTVVCCALLGLAGCGGDEDESRDSTDNVRSPLLSGERAGRSGTLEQTACSLVRSADVQEALGLRERYRLKTRRNDSLDLSSCDWSGGPVELVRLSIDAAPSPELRFSNLLAEQLEYHNAEPARKPRQIRGVGRDSAYGGAGAWWTRGRSQLIAFKRKRILRIRVNARGLDDAGRRRAAVRIGRLTFRGLG